MNNFSLILLIGLIFYFGINYEQFKTYSTDINNKLKELEGNDYYKLLYLFVRWLLYCSLLYF